jgi:hypothetical protein
VELGRWHRHARARSIRGVALSLIAQHFFDGRKRGFYVQQFGNVCFGQP